MKARELSIAGLYLIESAVFDDGRGVFREWFKDTDLTPDGIEFAVRQSNLSHSIHGTIRGLHYSLAPEGQAKLVTCVAGELDDVIVDIRVGSPTYGSLEYVTLGANDGLSILVPAGAAHGYCVPGEHASIAYLLTSPYNPTMEFEISPFDAEIAVPWRVTSDPVLSAKDAAAPSLAERHERGELPIF